MHNLYIKFITKTIVSFLFICLLQACGSDDRNNSAVTEKATTELPADLQKLTLPGGGTLSAYVTIDGKTLSRVQMTINTTGTGSASASIPSLSRASHDIVITYEYTDGTGTIILATASSTVDLSSGSGSLSFVAGDYNLSSYDEDGDGISNAAELSAGSDPWDSVCELGTSGLSNCTLG
jgi:thrombospondin type 3 repeat protein